MYECQGDKIVHIPSLSCTSKTCKVFLYRIKCSEKVFTRKTDLNTVETVIMFPPQNRARSRTCYLHVILFRQCSHEVEV